LTIGEAAQLMTAVAALGAMLLSWRNSRKIKEVHLMINSKMSDLLALTRTSATAEGVLAGRAQVHEETAAEKR
jgi:hypothetical protein